MTITEFLAARLDEEEWAARFAFGAHNDAGPDWREVRSGAISLGDHEEELLTFDAGVSRHIVRNDPARVLREIEVKRRIIDLCEQRARIEQGESQGVPDAELLRNDLVLQALASVYSDHRDYAKIRIP
ncbi:DUF6221 family protein [Nocardiopsis sp. NRRL B-16309]|uniref:DUF6221 family protein n=1 Tax=Nocardiopsis sp. NRRL B-16309 TaxID=1519494 RepID=UPI0006ADE133|nr:DUF6221 family protein [Nocardiopsis sp. NRRL B-16309]KOX10127.1 hypothetical protein ADL05_25945 [Nocardiopsis sp. NRRL B-16309]